MLANRLRVHGRVQGVGFRAFVYRQARLAGIDGWVRNRRDGTVEALVWGEPNAVDALVARIEEGPRNGRVDRVDVTVDNGADDRRRGFDIRSDR